MVIFDRLDLDRDVALAPESLEKFLPMTGEIFGGGDLHMIDIGTATG